MVSLVLSSPLFVPLSVASRHVRGDRCCRGRGVDGDGQYRRGRALIASLVGLFDGEVVHAISQSTAGDAPVARTIGDGGADNRGAVTVV